MAATAHSKRMWPGGCRSKVPEVSTKMGRQGCFSSGGAAGPVDGGGVWFTTAARGWCWRTRCRRARLCTHLHRQADVSAEAAVDPFAHAHRQPCNEIWRLAEGGERR